MSSPDIAYAIEPSIDLESFLDVLTQSKLGERRPMADRPRMLRMLTGSSFFATAREEGRVVGLARTLCDYSSVCYICDLAVIERLKGRGIGRRLLEMCHRDAGPECSLVLTSAPDAMAFYAHVGMTRSDRIFEWRRER